MAFETRKAYGSSTSAISNDKIDGTALKCSANLKLVLPILQELKNNPQTNIPARFDYPLTLKEYRYLLDILPEVKGLRNIWCRNRDRVEYLYLSQQLMILPSPGHRHQAAVTETAEWIKKPIERLKDKYEDNENNLSPTDRKTWEWYKLLVNAGASIADYPEAPHCPDAQYGSCKEGIFPLVLEVADSQQLNALSNLAAEYLGLGRGLIKYVFAIDIREMAHGLDVDFIMWKHVRIGEYHSAEQCAVYSLVRAGDTQINITATISYPLSHIIGNPPEGCDDLIVILRISDLIERIASILPLNEIAKNNRKQFILASGKPTIPPWFKEQKKAVKEFDNYVSGSEVDDEQNDTSYRPSNTDALVENARDKICTRERKNHHTRSG